VVAEDALDRFVLGWFERHARNRPARAIMRTIVDPSRARPTWQPTDCRGIGRPVR
jgi:hypothetical protein